VVHLPAILGKGFRLPLSNHQLRNWSSF